MLKLPESGPNARRICPDRFGFEWWYIQLVSTTYIGTIVLHTTPLLGGSISEPYLSVWIRTTDGTTVDVKVPQADFSLQFDGDSVLLELESVRVSASGTITAQAPGLRLEDNAVVARQDGSMTRWEVPIPAGHWKGSIRVAETEISTRATAYQDHNWGVGRLSDYFAAWSWSSLSAVADVFVSTSVVGKFRRQTFDYRHGVDPQARDEGEIVKTRTYLDGSDTAEYQRTLFWQPARGTGGFLETLSFN